jgi:hypothetical protein
MPLQLEMKPHDEPAGGIVVKHLWPFEDASAGDLAFLIVDYAKGYAGICPVVKICRRVNVYANVRHVTLFAGELVFAKPVVNSIMEEQPAAMRIDVNAIVIRPQLAGLKRRLHI